MNIIISNANGKPIYEQITSQIKSMILNGELKAGDMLPSMRLLARDLHISLITTKRAYEDLEKEGFISSVVGKGSFVRETDNSLVREERLRTIEKHLTIAVETARQSGIDQAEVVEMLSLLYEEEE